MARPAGITQVGDERRSEILRKAEDLLVAGTFREMTMDSIAASIGVAKATVYHYFSRKDDILFELMNETLTILIATQSRRADSGMTPSQQIYECMCDIMELTAKSPGRARALYEQKRTLNDDQQRLLSTKEREYFEQIASTVRKGVAAGELRDLDPTTAAHAITAMVAHTRHWYSAEGRSTPREVAFSFWQIFMDGARATSDQPVPAPTGS